MKSGNLTFLEPSGPLHVRQFLCAKRLFNLNYGRCKLRVCRTTCMLYVTSRRKPQTHTLPPHYRLWGRILSPPLLKIRPKGIREWNILLIQLWGYAFLSEVMIIFGNASDSGLHPVTSPNQGFSCYITRGVGSLAGHSWSSLAAGIAARLPLKISLCARSLSTNRTYQIDKGCIASIITTAHYIS